MTPAGSRRRRVQVQKRLGDASEFNKGPQCVRVGRSFSLISGLLACHIPDSSNSVLLLTHCNQDLKIIRLREIGKTTIANVYILRRWDRAVKTSDQVSPCFMNDPLKSCLEGSRFVCRAKKKVAWELLTERRTRHAFFPSSREGRLCDDNRRERGRSQEAKSAVPVLLLLPFPRLIMRWWLTSMNYAWFTLTT